MAHVIIIGAGQAGYSCAGRLRGDGFDGDITLVGTESAPPYQRPPLSKGYLLGALETERLYLRPMSFYQDNNITLRLNQTVRTVDSTAQTITINDEVLHYTDLVFTTGSEPRRLPDAVGGGLRGVYTLRGLDCVNRLRGEFKKDQHLLIIGGGYIGLETAAVARQMGVRVSLIEMSERILQRVAAPQTSDFFRSLHTEHGTDIIEGVGLKTLLGDTRVRQAELTDGRILDIDFAIAGIGILPRTELAEATGITLDNGIKTDAFGQTSHPHIWAAGDCASFPYKDGRLRLESVPHAIEHGEIVAQNIMGGGASYTAKPWFWSDQFDVKLQIAGLNTGYDNVITRKGDTGVSFWYYLGDTLLAVDAMNDARGYMVGKRLLEAGKTADKTAIANPQTDLKTLL